MLTVPTPPRPPAHIILITIPQSISALTSLDLSALQTIQGYLYFSVMITRMPITLMTHTSAEQTIHTKTHTNTNTRKHTHTHTHLKGCTCTIDIMTNLPPIAPSPPYILLPSTSVAYIHTYTNETHTHTRTSIQTHTKPLTHTYVSHTHTHTTDTHHRRIDTHTINDTQRNQRVHTLKRHFDHPASHHSLPETHTAHTTLTRSHTDTHTIIHTRSNKRLTHTHTVTFHPCGLCRPPPSSHPYHPHHHTTVQLHSDLTQHTQHT